MYVHTVNILFFLKFTNLYNQNFYNQLAGINLCQFLRLVAYICLKYTFSLPEKLNGNLFHVGHNMDEHHVGKKYFYSM